MDFAPPCSVHPGSPPPQSQRSAASYPVAHRGGTFAPLASICAGRTAVRGRHPRSGPPGSPARVAQQVKAGGVCLSAGLRGFFQCNPQGKESRFLRCPRRASLASERELDSHTLCLALTRALYRSPLSGCYTPAAPHFCCPTFPVNTPLQRAGSWCCTKPATLPLA
ncbi:hypothetical protein SKAU_G00123460 [Synaphobranchus kaupii]|uniref:Uncharacterized protein n=1 Tax=Synaphobranchus kaupii TaxID=118154 RepID=A0A9Q1J2R6_SYNKA|nr:hypothetical protein SKAU_G00123460 [Synaphobranchus kaupii]